ncbi:MAG: hypothetical protein ACUVX9_09640 [Anaerolineae bacterium]
MVTRRSVVRALAAMAGTLLLPLDRLASRLSPAVVQAQPTDEGEPHAGFLLLSPDGSVPPSVSYPEMEDLFTGDAITGECGPLPGAVTTSRDTAGQLAQAERFPVFDLGTPPSGHRGGAITLIRHNKGEVLGGSLSYEAYNGVVGTWENTLSISADLHYPRPCPLWPGSAGDPTEKPAELEKVDFLPSPGVMMRSAAGYVFYWIWQNVFYTMRVEFGPSYWEAVRVASSVVLVDG